jgi:hypothetical protein
MTGSITGVGMLLVRFAEASHRSAVWLRTYDGVSILVNTLITGVGMWAGSYLLATAPSERRKIQTFFEGLREPLKASPARSGPHAEIAKVTVAVGVLLGIAGVVSASAHAREADSIVAAALVAIGGMMWISRDRSGDDAARGVSHVSKP